MSLFRLFSLKPLRHRKGFSLLEMALTLGVTGTVLAGIWQLVGTSTQVRDAAAVATHALSVSAASESYIRGQRTALLALGGLSALNNVIRVKITDADTGDTANSLVGAGYLPSSFVNANSYGQSYQLYVRREDGGTIGSVDANDRLVGLLITTGGVSIADTMGARIAGIMGAPGGFLYTANNPASPTAATTARGNSGAWQVDLTATGWSGISTAATAGRLAALTNLTPQNTAGSGGAGGSSGASAASIDELTDAVTDYSTKYNIFMGNTAGANSTTEGYNTAIGYGALARISSTNPNSNNTAMGYNAMRGFWVGMTGLNNVGVGASAMVDLWSGNQNVAIGSGVAWGNSGGSNNTGVGYGAYGRTSGSNITAIGSYAGASQSYNTDGTGTTLVGAYTGHQMFGEYTTAVGAYIGSYGQGPGHQQVALGYGSLNKNSLNSIGNVAIGYQAGQNITDGDYNIVIGSGTDTPAATDNYRLNIGNLIYGKLDTYQVNIGNPTLTSNISFDVGRTDSARMPVGTTAQRPTCDATIEGGQRWNTTLGQMEFCNGTAWVQQVVPGTASTPTAPTGIGYIVLTNSTWDGNLGGQAGADAKCVADLTANDWMGKAAATAAGQVNAEKIQAMLWAQGYSCNDQWFSLVRSARYYYALSGDNTKGGASVVIDSNATWFPDSAVWSGATYFGASYTFWTMTDNCDTANYGCSAWTSSSSSKSGCVGQTTSAAARSCGTSAACNATRRLVCLVHP